MTDFFIDNEPAIRLGAFVSILLGMMVIESLFPRRTLKVSRRRRWVSNLAIVFIDGLFVRFLFPVAAVGIAAVCARKGWGAFNIIDWPVWLEIIVAIIILDMMIYLQHVVSHHVPVFWAIHKVHHADRDIDVTTGFRFHPAEIILSMVFKMGLVVVLGPAVVAVIIFELILNGCAMFNHANVKIPRKVDAVLRRLIVTPDMHRVHHSTLPYETNRNFGFSLSVWDYIFGTYRAQPQHGHDDMTIGLKAHQTVGPMSFVWSLWLPIKSSKRLETWF